MLQEGRRTQDVVGCKLWKTGPWICQWRISTERPRQRHSSKAWARESQRMDSTGDCELRKAGDLTRANCNFPGQLLWTLLMGSWQTRSQILIMWPKDAAAVISANHLGNNHILVLASDKSVYDSFQQLPSHDLLNHGLLSISNFLVSYGTQNVVHYFTIYHVM